MSDAQIDCARSHPLYGLTQFHDGQMVPRVWIPPAPSFGTQYGPHLLTKKGQPMWMFRKGQRVRFFDGNGRQVGPEQMNVCPAICFAQSEGWS